MNKKELYNKIPPEIRKLLVLSNGWLVGGSINQLLNNEPIKDFDILVDIQHWKNTCLFLDTNNCPFVINSHGGLKVKYGEHLIDIWTQDFTEFIISQKNYNSDNNYLYNISKCIVIKIE